MSQALGQALAYIAIVVVVALMVVVIVTDKSPRLVGETCDTMKYPGGTGPGACKGTYRR